MGPTANDAAALDIDSMGCKELRAELRRRGKPVSGKKAELKKRLREAVEMDDEMDDDDEEEESEEEEDRDDGLPKLHDDDTGDGAQHEHSAAASAMDHDAPPAVDRPRRGTGPRKRNHEPGDDPEKDHQRARR